MRLDQQLGSIFLATGEYQISVVNHDPSLSEASYTLVASVDDTPTVLRSGSPVFGIASLGRPAFFKFEQAQQPGLRCSLATHPSPLTTHPSPPTTRYCVTRR